MLKLSDSIQSFIKASGKDVQGMMAAAKAKTAYKDAVEHVWKERVASEMILSHTNAVYIRNDTTPRKGPDKDKPYIVFEICIDDPTVRSEVDNMRGLLEISLRRAGLTFEELRLIPARRGMRKRHLYE